MHSADAHEWGTIPDGSVKVEELPVRRREAARRASCSKPASPGRSRLSRTAVTSCAELAISRIRAPGRSPAGMVSVPGCFESQERLQTLEEDTALNGFSTAMGEVSAANAAITCDELEAGR